MSDQSASPVHVRDFAALQSPAFRYQPGPRAYPAMPASLPPAEVGRKEVALDELSFFRLTAPSDIAEIHHLRAELQLPASVLADADFQALEKKETRSGSWARSNTRASSLEPSASSL
jgi:hypothetical protein